MAGQAADLADRRERALEYYDRVLDGDRFLGKSAAYLYTATPFSGHVYQTRVLGTP